MKSWMTVLVADDDMAAALRQQGANRRAGWAATDDKYFAVLNCGRHG